jgi:hypothetical protein
MAGLSATQRNFHYCNEATRTGIHQPILAALYAAHHRPRLEDGTDGLGVSPANRIALEQVTTFDTQVQFAANTIRSITDKLTAQGWKGSDIWNTAEGCYSDRFLQSVANGYTPPTSDLAAARLEATDLQKLRAAYLDNWALDCQAADLSPDQSFLDAALLQIAEQISRYYIGLSYQRDAFLEAVRIWRKLNSRQAAIASLLRVNEADPSSSLDALDRTPLDRPLVQFIQQLAPFYAGYPHQRESLLRLVQLWRQLESREVAIASLQTNASPETNIRILDPALIVFAQRLPQHYQGKGDQRNAMTEAFRLWYDLESRGAALKALGVDSRVLTASNPDRNALMNAAAQLDRALLDFIKRIPLIYEETDRQREALIRLTQLWQSLEGRDRAIQLLLEESIRLEQIRRDAPEAPPSPEPLPLPARPEQWTVDNLGDGLQIHAPILANGNLTWATATQGGLYLPLRSETIEAIVHMAGLVQQIRDRLNRPLYITKWYCPAENEVGKSAAGESGVGKRQPGDQSRHFVGDAIEFYCDGLTGNQIYRALDSWWTGSLGRYQAAHLCYVDARDYRVRWTK